MATSATLVGYPVVRRLHVAAALVESTPPLTDADRRPTTPTTTLRFTRLGYQAAVVTVAVLGVALLLLAHLSAPGTTDASRRPGVVTVQAGDTLWSIAQGVTPNRDPRAVVDEIVSRNHLAGVQLTPGQQLVVG